MSKTTFPLVDFALELHVKATVFCNVLSDTSQLLDVDFRNYPTIVVIK